MPEFDRREVLKLTAAGALASLLEGTGGAAISAEARSVAASSPSLAGLARDFLDPPADARPGIFWYWMNGNVTREGITADLTAMQTAGIRTVLLFSVGGEGPATVVEPAAQSLSPYWWALVRFAIDEARRLGLELALNVCDGWATASGPWITPDLSMQKLTWAEREIIGGQRVQTVLPQPPTIAGYYRDVRCVAYRGPPFAQDEARAAAAQLSGTLARGTNAALVLQPGNQQLAIDSEESGDLIVSFAEPFLLRSVTVRTPPFPGPFAGVQRAANNLFVDAGEDDGSWREIGRLEYPRHGWETALLQLTHALPPTRARRFRFRYLSQTAQPFTEDRYHAATKRLRLLGLHLSSRARVPLVHARNGEVWASAMPVSEQVLRAADCIGVEDLVDLSHLMQSDGSLDWRAPAGHWTLLRIGCTSTGKANSIAGGGKGLECDKLSRVVARVQFEGWFGRALQVAGTENAGKSLHILHIDSWEAGSQNWTAQLPQEFQRRRGYDLLPQLAILAGVPLRNAEHVERVLFDLRLTLSELVGDEFFAEMTRLAHQHGCLVSGETVNPTMIADGLDYGRFVDVPMGEFWLRSPQNLKPHDIADAVSTAHVHGRRIAGAEAFTEWDLKWDETPWMLKALGDHHFAQGINRFYLHVYAHQPWLDRVPGMTLSGVGTFFSRTQTWWQQGRAWFDYLARSQALLQAGTSIVDVAAFIGEDIPARSLLEGELPVALPAGYRHESINRQALLQVVRVEQGLLVAPGGARYHALVLPRAERMTSELTQRLAQFVAQGLAVIGEPQLRDAVPAMQLTPYAQFAAQLAARCEPDVLLSGNPASVEWLHRAGRDWNLYFFSNQGDATVEFQADVRATGQPQRWSADSQVHEPLVSWQSARGRTQFGLALAPREAVFIVIDASRTGDPVTSVDRAGATLGWSVHGEVLRSAQAGEWVLQRRSGRKVVRRIATLPRSQALAGWHLQFPGQEPHPLTSLGSWTRSDVEAIRHFSGTATYSTTLRAERNRHWGWLLELGVVADIAEVFLNDKPLGVLWKPPFSVDCTAALGRGDNRLVVAVTNTWLNRLVGDAGRTQRSTFVTPEMHFGSLWQPRAGDALLPAGLLGPVSLRAMGEVGID